MPASKKVRVRCSGDCPNQNDKTSLLHSHSCDAQARLRLTGKLQRARSEREDAGRIIRDWAKRFADLAQERRKSDDARNKTIAQLRHLRGLAQLGAQVNVHATFQSFSFDAEMDQLENIIRGLA